MVFRANESASASLERAIRFYALNPHNDLSPKEREQAAEYLRTLTRELGPVIGSYPTWHPFVRHKKDGMFDFPGLDHVLCFAHGFITAPYGEGNAEQTRAAIEALPSMPDAEISVEVPEVKLYNSDVHPLLVRCIWDYKLLPDMTVPPKVVIPALLMHELPCAYGAVYSESWERMASDFLGYPHGKVSSHFVNAETGRAIKKIWQALNDAEIFGPAREKL